MTRTTFKTQKASILPTEPSKIPMPPAKPTLGERGPLLTFRRSRTGNLVAAYRAEVRVGYVEYSPPRASGRPQSWMWWLNLLNPTGGQITGRSSSEQIAQDDLLNAFKAWMVHAQLQEKT